jgi:hypothetical protein
MTKLYNHASDEIMPLTSNSATGELEGFRRVLVEEL